MVHDNFINTTRELFDAFGEDRIRFEDDMLLSIRIFSEDHYNEQIERLRKIFAGFPRRNFPIMNQVTRCRQWEIDHNRSLKDSVVRNMHRLYRDNKVKNPMKYLRV